MARPGDATRALCSFDSERTIDGGFVRPLIDKILETRLARLDQGLLDELGAHARSVLSILDRAFPLKDGPAVVSVDGKAGENGAEIDIAVAERAETAGAVRGEGGEGYVIEQD
jgi:hypothetical protein